MERVHFSNHAIRWQLAGPFLERAASVLNGAVLLVPLEPSPALEVGSWVADVHAVLCSAELEGPLTSAALRYDPMEDFTTVYEPPTRPSGVGVGQRHGLW